MRESETALVVSLFFSIKVQIRPQDELLWYDFTWKGLSSMRLIKMEYRGLNIFDEISSVEVAFDVEAVTIHIVDDNMAVAPTYHFTKKQDELSEGFLKMAQVLYQKRYMKAEVESLQQWINSITWHFYGLADVVKTYENGSFTKNKVASLITWNDEALQQANFYPPYIRKGKST